MRGSGARAKVWQRVPDAEAALDRLIPALNTAGVLEERVRKAAAGAGGVPEGCVVKAAGRLASAKKKRGKPGTFAALTVGLERGKAACDKARAKVRLLDGLEAVRERSERYAGDDPLPDCVPLQEGAWAAANERAKCSVVRGAKGRGHTVKSGPEGLNTMSRDIDGGDEPHTPVQR